MATKVASRVYVFQLRHLEAAFLLGPSSRMSREGTVADPPWDSEGQCDGRGESCGVISSGWKGRPCPKGAVVLCRQSWGLCSGGSQRTGQSSGQRGLRYLRKLPSSERAHVQPGPHGGGVTRKSSPPEFCCSRTKFLTEFLDP